MNTGPHPLRRKDPRWLVTGILIYSGWTVPVLALPTKAEKMFRSTPAALNSRSLTEAIANLCLLGSVKTND